MNRSLSHKLSYIMLLFIHIVVILLFVGCQDDDYSSPGHGPAGGSARDVTFTLKLPGAASYNAPDGPGTRAMTASEEERIADVHILAFVEDPDSGDYLFTYRATGKDITLASGTVTFKVRLLQYGSRQKFVILTNSQSFINIGGAGGILLTDDIATALPKLIANSATEWKARNTSPGDPVDYIPMYAQTEAMMINQSTTQVGSSSYTLIRMLARLDVAVQGTVTNFRLLSASLFNRKNMGYIAYNPAKWDAANQQVTAADMPATTPGFATTKLPTVRFPANASHRIERGIYTFEVGGVTDKRDATAIVVGGYYGYPANQSQISYYRVDIPKFRADGTEIPGTFGDILRNHKYNIAIKQVSKRGAQTEEDAFNGAAWVEANIIPWNLADMDNIKFEGIYGLKVSRSVFTARQPGATGRQLTIFTDYDEGWTAELIPASAAAWVRFAAGTVLSGAAGTPKTLTFDIQPNGSPVVRHAVLKVKAGGMIKYVDIFQSNDIQGDIFDWTNSDHDNATEFDGPYRLGVGRTNYELTRNARAGLELLISTDYPKGYSATTNAPWITITTNGNSSGPATQLLKFNVAENTGAARSGAIRIKAGNLVKVIFVDQSNVSNTGSESPILPWAESNNDAGTAFDGPYRLDVSRASYSLYKNVGANIPLILTTDWPKGWKATATQPWIHITAHGTHPSAGSETLTFSVDENNTKATRSGKIRVQANNLIKEVTVKQSSTASVDGNVEISPWDNGGIDPDTELEIGKPRSLELSRSNCRYDGPAKTRTIKVTATGGGTWTATSNVSWITLTQASGAANGTQNNLTFNVAAHTSGADRSGKITVKTGNITKEIKITQYAGPAMEFPAVAAAADLGLGNFTIKAKCPWIAQLQSDPQGIVEQLRTPSGVSNWAGSNFQYSIKKIVEAAIAKVRFTSINEEFDPYQMSLAIPFDLAGLWVYPVDQPRKQTWYTYSHNCASIPSVPGKSWRLPTSVELQQVLIASWGGNPANSAPAQTSLESYNFIWGATYWSATTVPSVVTSAYARSSIYANQGGGSKTNTGIKARCVRSK